MSDSNETKIPGKLISFFINILFRPLAFYAHIYPKIVKIRKQLKKKYGSAFLEENKYALEIGEKRPEMPYEYGKYRLYVPYEEAIRGLKEDTEAILIQETIRNSALTELDSIDKDFKKSFCVSETKEFLEKEKDGVNKSRNYYRKILEKNEQLEEEIDTVSALNEDKKLKPLLDKINTELKKGNQTSRITRNKDKIRKIIKSNLSKAKEKYLIENDEFDRTPDDKLIQHINASFFDHNHRHSQEQIVKYVISGKLPKSQNSDIISYFRIAKYITENPGKNVAQIAKKLGLTKPGALYGVVSLLEHDNGLGLLSRQKKKNGFSVYITDRFKNLLKEKGYKFKQTDLSDY
jgi:hypothetical protein